MKDDHLTKLINSSLNKYNENMKEAIDIRNQVNESMNTIVGTNKGSQLGGDYLFKSKSIDNTNSMNLTLEPKLNLIDVKNVPQSKSSL